MQTNIKHLGIKWLKVSYFHYNTKYLLLRLYGLSFRCWRPRNPFRVDLKSSDGKADGSAIVESVRAFIVGSQQEKTALQQEMTALQQKVAQREAEKNSVVQVS